MIQRLCVIGVGLIGGSLVRGLREANAVEHVVGCGRGTANLTRAVELGVIDEYSHEPARAVVGADMIVVATTLGASAKIFAEIAPALDEAAIVTDVGSAKRAVVDAAATAFGSQFSRFVPGHPIAGTEKSGVEASFSSLFRNHRVILTPSEATDPGALETVAEMWRTCGASVVEMDANLHDEVLAATSHLPHMLAYALVECLASMDESQRIFDFAAGGFRDFSRIASSNPAMWSDIAIDNRDALLVMLNRYTASLNSLREALESADKDALFELFENAKQTRDRVFPDTSK